MFLWVLTIFTGPFKQIATWASIIVVLFGLGFGYLKVKEHEAAQEALNRFNQAQLVQAQKENAQNKHDLDTLQTHTHELELEIAQADSQLTEREKFINDFITKHPGGVKLDPLFNNVLRQMRGK